MSSSTVETSSVLAIGVAVTDDALSVALTDGRSIGVPLAWYPRLVHGSRKERRSWRLIAGGRGIHWPDLDEDISVANLLAGRASNESQASLGKWLAGRKAKKARPLRSQE